MEDAIERIKIKLGNVLYILNRYPDRIFMHYPWMAHDQDLLSHLNSYGMDYSELSARRLNENKKKVRGMY